MRRFSQRTALVTLSDINITPLLDLAFVLLIIFVIISPSIRSAHEQSIRLNLPKGGQPERKLDAKDMMLVEITKNGGYVLNGRPVSSLQKLEAELVKTSQTHPNMVVNLRADVSSLYGLPYAVMNICMKHGIAIGLRGEPEH